METPTIRENRYRVIVEEIETKSGEAPQTLEFEFLDREDVLAAVANLKRGSGLEAPEATRVALALRLLGPVMMAQRKHPLFVDFMPHFKAFMTNLKQTVKNAVSKDR